MFTPCELDWVTAPWGHGGVNRGVVLDWLARRMRPPAGVNGIAYQFRGKGEKSVPDNFLAPGMESRGP